MEPREPVTDADPDLLPVRMLNECLVAKLDLVEASADMAVPVE